MHRTLIIGLLTDMTTKDLHRSSVQLDVDSSKKSLVGKKVVLSQVEGVPLD